MRDARLAAVEWRDLIPLSRFEVVRELALPFVASGFVGLAGVAHCWPLLALASGAMFMAGLRVTHGAFHHSLGLSGIANDALMFALSGLVGGSMHAIEVTHLRHHRDCLADDDVEGRIAALGFWRALFDSPRYPFAIHAAALRHGTPRQRRLIVAELVLVVLLQVLVWRSGDAVFQGIAVSLYVANASAAIPGIWFVHRGCRHGDDMIARSTRSRWLAWSTIDMFHHAEHHAFPAVPTCHLRELARRFDACAVAPPPIIGFSRSTHGRPWAGGLDRLAKRRAGAFFERTFARCGRPCVERHRPQIRPHPTLPRVRRPPSQRRTLP